jgi:hypothetical protein
LEKDFIFKLTPRDIGQLYSKYYRIDISQVDVEIYLEFETHLVPLCKLKDLLNITLFAKQIFDISQTEGELLYIWVIFHHRWFVHKKLTNHHSYERKIINFRIEDFIPDNWFNRHHYRGYFRNSWEIDVSAQLDMGKVLDECNRKTREENRFVEFYWLVGQREWLKVKKRRTKKIHGLFGKHQNRDNT